MKKSIKMLARELDFDSIHEYYDYLIECYINGNFTSCKELFNEMKLVDQKEFIRYIPYLNIDARTFYFNLL